MQTQIRYCRNFWAWSSSTSKGLKTLKTTLWIKKSIRKASSEQSFILYESMLQNCLKLLLQLFVSWHSTNCTSQWVWNVTLATCETALHFTMPSRSLDQKWFYTKTFLPTPRPKAPNERQKHITTRPKTGWKKKTTQRVRKRHSFGKTSLWRASPKTCRGTCAKSPLHCTETFGWGGRPCAVKMCRTMIQDGLGFERWVHEIQPPKPPARQPPAQLAPAAHAPPPQAPAPPHSAADRGVTS